MTHEKDINALLSIINHISSKTIEDNLPDNDDIDNDDDNGTLIDIISSIYVDQHYLDTVSVGVRSAKRRVQVNITVINVDLSILSL